MKLYVFSPIPAPSWEQICRRANVGGLVNFATTLKDFCQVITSLACRARRRRRRRRRGCCCCCRCCWQASSSSAARQHELFHRRQPPTQSLIVNSSNCLAGESLSPEARHHSSCKHAPASFSRRAISLARSLASLPGCWLKGFARPWLSVCCANSAAVWRSDGVHGFANKFSKLHYVEPLSRSLCSCALQCNPLTTKLAS